MPKQYKISLRTLNIPLERGGVRLTTHESNVVRNDGFALSCAAMDFTNCFGSDHNEGKQIISSLKECVRKEAMSVSETSLRNTGKLHIEHSLYVFDIAPVVDDSVL